MHKHPISLAQLRRVPRQFSWVDQRLVRDHYIDQLSPQACALYLFLVTVADAQGLSYYADRVPVPALIHDSAKGSTRRDRRSSSWAWSPINARSTRS